MKIVSKDLPLDHYHWGDDGEAWNLVQEEGLSIKIEQMQPYTAELKHVHLYARQFFYILKGQAIIEWQDQRLCLNAEQGIQIIPGIAHRIINETHDTLEFVLVSQPPTSNDRKNVE